MNMLMICQDYKQNIIYFPFQREIIKKNRFKKKLRQNQNKEGNFKMCF